ncbi:phage protein GemA/Gp16 family protein [Stenotrophomonas maltophilia]|uniref:regulatory protein GemA n=1 Tax=Stenotrophomonas maltophilia TaxID=40324 RepID=UPI00130FC01A|nr:regulatory protein GemA [Stenotrophomonas maltophilia]
MARSRPPTDRRKRTLAAIHAAAKALGLAEDVYRDLVQRVSGQSGQPQRSAGSCDQRQLDAIANELRRLGGMPARAARAAERWAGRPKGDLAPQLAKVEALLADAGRPWAYAHSLALRMCKVTRIEWCNKEQLQKVIAALQYDANRRANAVPKDVP